MTGFIDEHRGRFGVEPICSVLGASPSTYYARKTRPRSPRAHEDERLLAQIRQVHALNYGVYGPPPGLEAAPPRGRRGRPRPRCPADASSGLAGIQRGTRWRTTIPDLEAKRASDLVERRFVATRPNQLWVADLTYVRSFEGFSYLAFVLDVYSRLIVGWQLANHLRTDLVLDALELAVCHRDLKQGRLVHHSDRGSQYTSFRYTSRLGELGISASVGSVADAYDNAKVQPPSPPLVPWSRATLGVRGNELQEAQQEEPNRVSHITQPLPNPGHVTQGTPAGAVPQPCRSGAAAGSDTVERASGR